MVCVLCVVCVYVLCRYYGSPQGCHDLPRQCHLDCQGEYIASSLCLHGYLIIHYFIDSLIRSLTVGRYNCILRLSLAISSPDLYLYQYLLDAYSLLTTLYIFSIIPQLFHFFFFRFFLLFFISLLLTYPPCLFPPFFYLLNTLTHHLHSYFRV